MQDNNTPIFRVSLSNGTSRDYTEKDYRDLHIADWLNENHNGNYSVYKLNDAPADTIADDQDYVVSFTKDGQTKSKLYSGQEYKNLGMSDWLEKEHAGNYQVQSVRGYRDAYLAADEDYWKNKADEQKAAIDKFDQDNHDFMFKHDMETKLYQAGEGNGISDDYINDDAKYRELVRQKQKLQADLSNNPYIKSTYKANAEYADEKAAEYDDIINGMDPQTSEEKDERTYFKQARKLQKDVAKIYSVDTMKEPGENTASDYLKNFIKGHGDTFSDIDFWTMNFTEISRNLNVRNIMKGLQNKGINLLNATEKDIDDNLTPGEKALLQAFFMKSEAEYQRAKDMAPGYTAGQTSAESLEFMAEFLISGGIGRGLAAAGAKGLKSWIGRAIRTGSENAIRSSVKRGMIGALTRGGEKALTKGMKTATDIASKAVSGAYGAGIKPIGQAVWHTAVQPSTYRTITENMTQIQDNGELMKASDAIWGGVLDQMIENWSESMGGTVETVLGAPFKLAGWSGEKILGKTTLGQWGKWLADSQAAKVLHDAGFNGLIGEMGEEWLGNAVRVGFGLMSGDEFKDFASWHEQLEMAASFAPISLFGLGTTTYAASRQAKNYKRTAEAMRGVLNRAGMTEDEIADIMDTKHTKKEIADALTPVMQRIVHGRETNDTAMEDYITTLRFAQASAMNEVLATAQSIEKETARKEKRNDIARDLGAKGEEVETDGEKKLIYTNDERGKFTHIMQTDRVDAEGKPYELEAVTTVKDADGNEWFYMGSDGSQVVLKKIGTEGGKPMFLTQEQYAQRVESGEYVENTQLATQYLDEQIEKERSAEERNRRNKELQDKYNAVAQRIQVGSTIDLGTEDAPMKGVVMAMGRDGVIVDFGDPVLLNGETLQIHRLSLEQAGNAVGVDASTKSDEQQERDAIDREDTNRKRIDTLNRTFQNKDFTVNGDHYVYTRMFEAPFIDENGTEVAKVTATDELGNEVEVTVPLQELQEQALTAEEQNGVDAEQDNTDASDDAAGRLKDFRGNDIPMHINEKTGEEEVDKREFKKRDPEAYYRWNDSRRGGDTSDSMEAIQADIAAKTKQKEEYVSKKQAETDPDLRDELEGQITRLDNDINLLAGIYLKYDAKMMFEYQQKRLQDNLNLDDIDINDVLLGDEMGTLTDEQKSIAMDYLNAKAALGSKSGQVRSDIADKVAVINNAIDSYVNVDNGQIVTATLKQDDRKVYIIGGNVDMTPDGSMVDSQKSDKLIIIKDAETGKISYVEPTQISRLNGNFDPVKEKDNAKQLVMQASAQSGDGTDGASQFNLGNTYQLTTEDGQTFPIQISNEQKPEAIEQEPTETEQETALSRIPVDKNGNAQFEEAQPSDTWKALVEMNEGDATEAEDTAKQMYDNATKELDKAQKAKPKAGTTVMEIQKNKAEYKSKLDKLQAKVDYWSKVLSFPEAERKAAAIAAENAKTEAKQQANDNLAKGRKIMQEKGTYYKEDSKLGDYLNFEDFALRMIANGRVKFVWKSDPNNSAIKGLGVHLGFEDNENERKRVFSILANADKGGLRPDEAAQELAEIYNSSNDNESIDTMQALDTILDIIRSYGGKTRDMMNAAIAAHANVGMDERGYMEDRQGNPINPDGTLYAESVSSIDEITDEDFTEPTRSIALPKIPENVDNAIGANGKPVIIKKNIFKRNSQAHPEVSPQQAREILSSALYRPDLYGQNQKTSRPYNWIVISTKDSAGQNRLVVLEVNENKDNVEIIHWYNARNSSIEQIKRQAQKEGGLILILPSETEEAGGLSSRQSGLSSEGKDTNIYEESNIESEKPVTEQITEQRKVVNTEPTEAQKEAGNYRMGHVKIDGMDVTIENPKGSIRRGTDADGKEWQSEIHYDYGYIRGTKAVDNDHIDIFLSDNPETGNVFVVDQVNPKTGKFDESKVMYGFASEQEARDAYLSNYEEGWKGLGKITEVTKEEFKRWIDSSTRKTKPFSEYARVKVTEVQKEKATDNQGNPINEDGTLKFDKIKSIDDLTDSDFSKPYRNVALPALPENVDSAIGAEGKPVIIKKSIFEKVSKAHSFSADESRKILKEALYNPDIVGQSQPKSKKNNWIAIKIDDSSPIVVLEVNRNKDNVEIVGWYTLDDRNLERIKRQAEREDGELLILTPKGAAASLSTLPSDLSSESKINKKITESQEDNRQNNKSEKIEDYGEQISGARKDMLRDLAKTIQNTSLESLISLPFSKAFKKPNLRKAVEEGALRDKDARFAQATIAAFLSTKKPVSGTKDEKRRQRWGQKTNVEKWAEKAYNGIKILQELFDADERVRDKVIEAAVADKYVGVAEAKAQQQRISDLNHREFNGTSYPLNIIALYNEVFDRLGYPAGQDTKIPVGRIACDSTFDSYSLRATNGEDWIYSSRSLKSFEDVVDELVYLIKVANADETADHPVENFKIRGINPKVETTGYRVLAAKNLTTAITRGNRFAVDETFPTREAALKRIEELKAKGLECSEPLERRETVGYEKYQISFAHPITREFIPLEKEYDSKEEAIAAREEEHEELNRLANEAIAAAARKSGESVEKSYFHITHYYDKGSDGKYHWYYGVALDDKYGPKKTAFNTMPFFLAERLNSREEAQKQIDANKERWESLVKDVVRQRSNFVYFSGDNETRKGEDYRNGKDVTAEEFANKFGFRGVQFGNWANQADRQAALNNAYDSFMDMSKIIGVSPKAMSLNGELGVAFGSRGSGAASAHYEPDEVVINLTKTRGAGSLAHEWWHALDNYFSRAANVKLGYVTSDKRLPMREEMRKAFNDLVDDVEKSDYHTRSMDRGSGYWGTRVEETARLFAEWIADEMAKRGELNNFLAGRNDSEDSYARMGYVFYRAIQKLQPEGEMMTFEEFRKTPMALKGFSYPTRAELETLGKDVRNIFGVVQERTDETTGNVALFQMVDKILSDNSPENRLAYEAVSQMLSNAGIPVELLSNQAMREMAINATMLDTALPEDESSFKGTVISSIDGANILNNLDKAIDDYQNVGDKGTKTFLGDLASALGSSDKDKSSQYATFETKNGQVVTIRVSNHNATVSNFDNAGESNGISIVISRKPNEGMTNDGDAHIVEFFYPDKALNKAEGKPLVEILKSIKQSLYSGDYKDTTGLAQREEVNAKDVPEFMTVYHGSGAKFDRFDHSHMGEGEGNQAFGWGTYVTEVEGIGRTYAKAAAAKDGDLMSRYTSYIRNRMASGISFEAAKKELMERLEKIYEKQTDETLYANFRESFKKLKALTERELPLRELYTVEIPEDINSALSKDEILKGLDSIGKELFSGYGLNDAQINAMFGTTRQWYELGRTATSDFFPLKEAFKTYGIDAETIDKRIHDEAMEDRRKNPAGYGQYLSWEKPLGEDGSNRFNGVISGVFEPLSKGVLELKTGKDIYNLLSRQYGSAQAASEKLEDLGYIGISYPAQYTSGGRSDGARNYVIFNENDAKITNRIEFLREPDGTVYGATVGGKIYLNRERLNPNTPIHEYTHLWFSALKDANPELYKRGVELMKQLPIWEEVRTDPNYANLSGDDAIASECLSRLVGDKGADVLTKMAKDANVSGDILGTAHRISLIEEFKDWLKRFWTWVRDSFTPWTKEEAARVSVDDIQNMVLSDLAKGVNPLANAREESELTKTNDKFNELLDTLTEDNADSVVLSLGRPSDILQSAGVKNKPMKLYGNKVMKKMRKHGFALDDLRDLPRAVADPIAVFNNYGEDGNRSILTELRTQQGNFLVSVNIGKDADIDFNIVRSVFGKGDENVVDWINKGLATYINKEKALSFLSHQSAPIAATAANAELLSAAKIVKDFENPIIPDATNVNSTSDLRKQSNLDAEYMAAVESGDMSKAQQMVKDAFRAAFPNNKLGSTIFYKGKNGEWKNQVGGFFTDSYEFADYFGDGESKRFFINMENPYEYDFMESGSDGDFPGTDGQTRNTYDIIKAADEAAVDNPYDGYILRNVGEGSTPGDFVVDDYITKISSNVKSAEPVTYDDNGKVIPLSKRFSDVDDIRFRISKDDTLSNGGNSEASENNGGDDETTERPFEDVMSSVRSRENTAKAKEGLQNFDKETVSDMLMKTFSDVPEDIRAKITDRAFNNGFNFGKATVNYFADLAEREDDLTDKEQKAVATMRDNMKEALGLDNLSLDDTLWSMFQTSMNGGRDILTAARRAIVADKLCQTPADETRRKKADDEIRFSIRREMESTSAAEMYNSASSYWANRLKESGLDMYESVNDLIEAIEKSTGKKAGSFEDIRLALNQQSSKGLAAMSKYTSDYLEPLWDAIKDVMQASGMEYDDVVRYVMLKHAIERNTVFAKRDAKAFYQAEFDNLVDPLKKERKELEKDRKKALASGDVMAANDCDIRIQTIDLQIAAAQAKLDRNNKMVDNGTSPKYREFRENDYGGLTSMYSEYPGLKPRKDYKSDNDYNRAARAVRKPLYQTVADMEAAAQKEVNAAEARVTGGQFDALWDRINAATKATLASQYKSNVISKAQYEAARDQFKYYVPLRGFKDDTAEDIWSYFNDSRSGSFAPSLVKAKGRKSEAENPFNWIGTMASSAIAQNIKNESKLALYYFISNRPNQDIVAVKDVWYQFDAAATAEYQKNNPGSKKRLFSAAYPPLNASLDTDAAKAAYDLWEEDMVKQAQQGLAYRGSNKPNVSEYVAFIEPKEIPQHIIRMKLRGKDVSLIINGNPRAAQAINGMLNIETEGAYKMIFGPVLRFMSAVRTSYNPEFWISNAQRDLLMAAMGMDIRGYGAGNFVSNVVNPRKIMRMMKDYKNGTLGNSEMENYYREFAESGAITGFTVVNGNDYWEKQINEFIDKSTFRKAVEKVKLDKFLQHWQDLGEAVEQMTRFSAFVSARKAGEGIVEATNLAKEISVNFNRKGSGQHIKWKELDTLTTKDGRPLSQAGKIAVYTLSLVPAYGRHAIMFFNAAIQGLNSMYKLWKINPKRFSGWMTGYFAIGVMQALLHALMDDDDDYLDINDYTRRNNLLLGYGGLYFKWSMPQEARAFYAMGDMFVNSLMGRTPDKNVVWESAKAFLDVMPISVDDGILGALPSVLQPAMDIARNKDFAGARIYNDMRFLSEDERSRTPKYPNALPNTGKVFINISKVLNNLSGGSEWDAGAINIHPETIQHIVENAGGGLLTTFDKIYETIGGAVDMATGLPITGEELSVRRFPFLNRILQVNDERTRNAHVSELFYFYKSEAEHTKTKLRKLKKNGDYDELDKLLNSDEFEIYGIYQKYEKLMKRYNEQIKIEDNKDERKALMREQDEYRKEMIREISEID